MTTQCRPIASLTVILALAIAAPSSAQNLLENGVFTSSAQLDGWSFAPGVTVTWAPLNYWGIFSGSARVEKTAPGPSTVGGVQCVPVGAGQTYHFTGAYSVPAADAAYELPRIEAAFFDNAGCSGGIALEWISVNVGGFPPPADEWVFDAVDAVAPPGAQGVQLWIRIQPINDPNATPTAYFDALYVPEPAGADRAAAGAAALALRRRRIPRRGAARAEV